MDEDWKKSWISSALRCKAYACCICEGGKLSAAIRCWCAERILSHCGNNINIEKGATFTASCEVGNNSGIGVNCTLYGKTIIGDNVMMGPNCMIYTQNHLFASTDVPMCNQGMSEERSVIIGNDVWIGCNVIILPGVHIGDGCVIGAGSVVTKNIEDYSVACGNPAIIIRNRKGENDESFHK